VLTMFSMLKSNFGERLNGKTPMVQVIGFSGRCDFSGKAPIT
jgi:hypothetical protein